MKLFAPKRKGKHKQVSHNSQTFGQNEEPPPTIIVISVLEHRHGVYRYVVQSFMVVSQVSSFYLADRILISHYCYFAAFLVKRQRPGLLTCWIAQYEPYR